MRDDEPPLTVAEVASRLNVDTQTVWRYIKNGVIEAAKLPSGCWRIQGESIRGAEQLHDLLFPAWIHRTRGVYFLQAGAFIKIGMGNCVLRRMKGISQVTPMVLVPLGFIRTDTCQAARVLEHELHTRFVDIRHKSEWFHAHDALLEFIKTAAEPWPTVAQRRDGWVHMMKLLKLKEAARQLGVDVQTVRRYIKNGALRAVKLPSGHLRVTDLDVEACVGKRGVERST